MREALIKAWREVVIPIEKQLENERKWEIFSYIFSYNLLISIVSLVLISCLMFMYEGSLLDIFSYNISSFVVLMLLLLTVCPLISLYINRNNCVFKIKDRDFFCKVLEKVSKKLVYLDNQQIISNQDLQKSSLFGDNDVVNSVEKSFIGKYMDVEYKVSEITINSSKREPVARKLVILYQFNKNVKAPFIIKTKIDDYYKIISVIFIYIALVMFSIYLFCNAQLFVEKFVVFCFLIVLYISSSFYKKRKLSKINLESDQWMKQFVLYSDDPVESRFVATTAFMNRYMNLVNVFRTKNISCSIFDNKLMFVVDSKMNFFDLGSIFVPIQSVEHIQRFCDDIQSITDIIDCFKLGEHTGL